MLRFACFFFVISFVFLFGSCNSDDGTSPIWDYTSKYHDYMPLKPGNTWYYTFTSLSHQGGANYSNDEYKGILSLKVIDIVQSGNLINYSILESFSGTRIYITNVYVYPDYKKTIDTTIFSNFTSVLYLVENTDSNIVRCKNQINVPFLQPDSFKRYGGKNSPDTLDSKPSFAISGLQRHKSGLGLTEYNGNYWHFSTTFQISAVLDSVNFNYNK